MAAQPFRVVVWPRASAAERAAEAVQAGRLYFLRGTLPLAAVERLARELLADIVTETFDIAQSIAPTPGEPGTRSIEVTLLPGVTDPVAENLLRAAPLLGIEGLEQAATGQCYLLPGTLDDAAAHRLAVEQFCNPVIQRYTLDAPIDPPFVPTQAVDATVETIPLREADDNVLLDISKGRRLSLDLAEMQAIRAYFAQEGRDPTDAELEMLAQTWSEHCVHKTFRAQISYDDGSGTPQEIDGLLKTYIRGATERLNKPWVRSAFVDNAGIVSFDEQWDLAFKVETHNRPSALEPFGGANTGVGGVVRDVLGVSARPIANTDVLCFGPPDLPADELPAGVLHPRRIAEGVVSGIEDYGNKMGIPTVNGAIIYHPGYTANPLVFCGCLGLLPRDSHPAAPQAGDLIVVLGGRTGRDGLRGATFSSMEIDQDTSTVSGSAVQIGHPIHEKQVLEVVLRARDERLYHAITDCGAGGLSSAVGEMGQHLGATVRLETVPLKYAGLRPWEIWLSEAQERMVLAVPPAHWPRLLDLCEGQEIEAVAIGTFEATGRLRLSYAAQQVGDIAMDFLHEGLPRRCLNASAAWQAAPPAPRPAPTDAAAALLDLLAQPTIRSKESVIRRYDHEVQGGTAVKPLVGPGGHGPGDATVLRPLDTVRSAQGVALGAGICPQYVVHDPYAMAWAAIDEAMRNVVAVGADPDRVALLDNFCWGSPTLPDRLGSLVRCAQGCYDAALAYGAPFVSGKDSLNNEYTGADGQRRAIPGTLLISALALVPDVEHTVTMDLKQSGSLLYLVGDTRDEHETQPPQPVAGALERMRALHRAIAGGLVQACHDCSEGGLGVALAEMCLAGGLGAEVDIRGVANDLPDTAALFAESLCRFVVEVRPEVAAAFTAKLAGVPLTRLGTVNESGVLHIRGQQGAELLRLPVAELERAWRGTATEAVPAETTPITAEAAPLSLQPAPGAPRVLILHATGTNRDREAALACEAAGGAPEIVHVNQLLAGERSLLDYHMLVLPGGFSYGDDLGAGTLWALDLQQRLGTEVTDFVASGRPVLGICNGFQALVRAGLLPGGMKQRRVTLAPNAGGHFECRWVYLQPNPRSPCLFTQGLDDLIHCPVAHGEGRVMAADELALRELSEANMIALTYTDAHGEPGGYPLNPNGSTLGIAGLCNAAGNVLGLMPHPEDHIFGWQHPRRHRGGAGLLGLHLFTNGLKVAR
jgi:phosphoribosylformylglycinamidine synthase